MKQQTMVVTMAMKSTTAEAMPAMVLGLWDAPGMSPQGRGGAGPARGLPSTSAQHPVPPPAPNTTAQYQCPAPAPRIQSPRPSTQKQAPGTHVCSSAPDTQHPWLRLSTQVPAPEGEAVALLALSDEVPGVEAAVPLVARAAAEGEELAVEAGVPGPVPVHVPQAVLASRHWGQPLSPGHLGAPGGTTSPASAIPSRASTGHILRSPNAVLYPTAPRPLSPHAPLHPVPMSPCILPHVLPWSILPHIPSYPARSCPLYPTPSYSMSPWILLHPAPCLPPQPHCILPLTLADLSPSYPAPRLPQASSPPGGSSSASRLYFRPEPPALPEIALRRGLGGGRRRRDSGREGTGVGLLPPGLPARSPPAPRGFGGLIRGSLTAQRDQRNSEPSEETEARPHAWEAPTSPRTGYPGSLHAAPGGKRLLGAPQKRQMGAVCWGAVLSGTRWCEQPPCKGSRSQPVAPGAIAR